MIATEADIPFIVELGRRAHSESAWAAIATFDAGDFEASCRHLMQDTDALVLVNDSASLWLKRFPLYFNHAETVSAEVFLHGRNAQMLRKTAERWAAGSLITMSRNAATPPTYDRVLTRAGYQPIEHTFIRRA